MDKRSMSLILITETLSDTEIGEFLLLCNVERPLRILLNLDQISDDDVYDWFRFRREDLERVLLALRFPPVIRLPNGSRYGGMEALCVLLRRLAYPNRYTDIKHIFGRSKPELSMIFSWAVEHVDSEFGHLLRSLDLCWLQRGDFELFAAAIRNRGSPLPDVWGFIDGTFRPTCRPGEDQKTLYSGHYRLHGIKFQAIMAPNGLIANLDGPWVGRRHDSGILADSGLLGDLEVKMNAIGRRFRLYGDPAYPISDYLEGPFKPARNLIEFDFNEAMAAVRVSVEWGFGEIIQQFAFLDFRKNLKVGLQPVGLLYTVGTLLTNCRVCLGYGGKVSDFFGVSPPRLETYLNNVLPQ